MTLLEDINTLIADPKVGIYEILDESEALAEDMGMIKFTRIANAYKGSGRWVERWRAVFLRQTSVVHDEGTDQWEERVNEYVAMDYEKPATEEQEGSEGVPVAYVVQPVQVIKTEYRKVENG